MSQKRWLEYSANFFNSVELNVTFYRLLQKKTFQDWHKRTPEDFHFIAKGSRFITYIKKLKDVKKEVRLFIDHVVELKKKIACLLAPFI